MHSSLVPLLLTSAGLLAAVPGTNPVQAGKSLQPEWIWATSDRHDPQRVELRTTFDPDGPVQRADLRLATEYTNCEVRFGDRLAFTLDDYGPWINLDVTDHVRSGKNRIALRCQGSHGPSAIVLELTITTTDGKRQVIRSGPGWQARVIGGDRATWSPSKSSGPVAAEYWNADRTARITPFDDYEQWREASDTDAAADPAKFLLRPGFKIERVRSAAENEGSWISLEFDQQGRLTIGREDKGLLRMTLSDDGRSITDVESIDDALLETRGLVYAHGSLFAQSNGTKSLYRLDDRDGDGRFETSEPLREFPGGPGHGRNDLAIGPDNAIYAIFGDAVQQPTENVVDHTSPFREARRGQRTTEGHVLRYFPGQSRWHLIAGGLRNPFGIAFNNDGEAFTYDADAEFDMGSPWYRPTRFVHIVSGGDYGWRGRTKTWPPYDADHADFSLPAGDIGKGSPTAVKSGTGSSFPPRYRRAMFALDWAYGRILAVHLLPRGAGYVSRAETFLKGRPLNVTDLEFGPDGSLYVVTGGRKTHSDLYRICWTGDVAAPQRTPQQVARTAFTQQQRAARRQLSSWHGHDGDLRAVSVIWDWIGHVDPVLRHAARVAIESQSTNKWSERSFDETRPAWVISAMLSLARSDRDGFIPRILEKLLTVPHDTLTAYDRSQLLETWSRLLAKSTAQDAPAFEATVDRVREWYPDTSPNIIAPTGAGRSVNHQLALLAERLDLPDLVPQTLQLLSHSRTQEERLHALFVLRNRREGWTLEARRTVFETLGELDRTVIGGEGMPGFLRQIREELIATLTESESTALGDLVMPGNEVEPPVLSIDRPVVKKWLAGDLSSLLAEGKTKPDPRRGRELFQVALCSRCHRAGNVGGTVGPDLTSVAGRFGRRDILLSILEPSRVVDGKYHSEQIVTIDGRVLVGRIVTGGDFRSTKIRLATDPLRPGQVIEIDKADIEMHRPSPQSPMPAGLLDTLTPDQIRDLLAFLERIP